MSDYRVLQGDCVAMLRTLPEASVQCCVTSPPYWGLRDYGVEGQIGLEKTPQEYVARMVAVFAEVWRVMKDDGTLWLNLGDSYAAGGHGGNPDDSPFQMQKSNRGSVHGRVKGLARVAPEGFKRKDLLGIPWRVAFALQEAGWYLRSDIIWAKPNCMPESVTDRPTRSHEYIFLLTKQERYFYDHEAIKEPAIYDVDGTGTAARKARQATDNKSMPNGKRNGIRPAGFKDAEKFNGKHEKQRGHSRRHAGFNDRWDKMSHVEQCTGYRNKRDVWTVAPANYPESHFATFPKALVSPCILAGSRIGDMVLDPFGGSGTTAEVAVEYARRCTLVELNPDYVKLINERLADVTPGLPLS